MTGAPPPARLLVLGSGPERRACAEALERAGYSVEEAEPEGATWATRRPAAELVLLVGAAPEGVRRLRGSGELGGAALLALGAGGDLGALREAGADDVLDSSEEGAIEGCEGMRAAGARDLRSQSCREAASRRFEPQVRVDGPDGAKAGCPGPERTESAFATLHGERLAARVDQLLRLRRGAGPMGPLQMQVLADLGGLGLSPRPLEDLLPLAVRRIAEGFGAGRCSALLAEGAPGGLIRFCAAPESPPGIGQPVELARCPEIGRALQALEPVPVDDAQGDPLLAEVRALLRPMQVRSIWVQPLPVRDEGMLLFVLSQVRRAGAFGPEERAFAAACGSALASAVRISKLQVEFRRAREALESAYDERHGVLAAANQRLTLLNRLKDEALAVCSHDLRGPLNILLGHARLLTEAELDPEESASAQAILRQGKKLFALIESQLDRRRDGLERPPLEAARLDLGEVCRERIAAHATLAAERGVRLEEDLGPGIELLADGPKLRQVLQNLIRHAIARAREGGAVRVQAQVREGPGRAVARVAISDDGCALHPDELLTLFERFRRGPFDPGLVLCRDYVELHGGEIWAESGPAHGAVVFFTLPIAG